MSNEDDGLTLEDLSKDTATAPELADAGAGGEPDTGDVASGESDADGVTARTAADLAAVYDIPVHVSAVLGKSKMQVSSLLKLGRGAVIELDRKVGEAIDIYVNNRLIARGEVVIVEDQLGVTMTEIIKGEHA